MKISPKDIHRTFFRNTFYPKSAFAGFTNSSYLQNGTIVVILCLYDKQLTEWMYEALSWLYPCLVSPMHEDRTYNVRSMRKRVLLTQPMTSWPHALWHYVWHQEHETEVFSSTQTGRRETGRRERGRRCNLQRDTHRPTSCIKESPPRVSRISQTGTTIWIPVKGISYSKYNKH